MAEVATGNRTEVRGNVVEQGEGKLVLALPSSEYQLHLVIQAPVKPAFNGRIKGVIDAVARRVDLTQDGRGGRFIEPIYGRPRRVQGRIIATDAAKNTLTVLAACPVNCTLTSPGQQASHFAIGQFVTFDVEPGARFTQTLD